MVGKADLRTCGRSPLLYSEKPLKNNGFNKNKAMQNLHIALLIKKRRVRERSS